MNKCNHNWKTEVSTGEWIGYGIDAIQVDVVWLECTICGATKDRKEY